MMKRRQLMRSVGAASLAAVGTTFLGGFQKSQAQTSSGVSVRSLGHTCFLFTGNNQRVLVNPFRRVGCTAGYPALNVTADVVLISSRLLDEGAVEDVQGNPTQLYEPGVYQLNGLQFQGIRTNHDRMDGMRFGLNIVWRWNQGGLNILHLGGAAAPITLEQQILMGRPDLLLLPVGGGPKAYNPTEAKAAMDFLQPKIVIPTHYRTQAADAASCDIVPVEEFLALVGGVPVRQANSSAIALSPADLPASGSVIQLLSYPS